MSLRIGLIGAGTIAKYHVAGYREASAEIVAVAEPRLDARKRFAEEFAIADGYDDPAAMLSARPDIDAVSIATPNRMHLPLAVQAFEAGRHVFCEKPPALNAAELELMIAASGKAGKRLQFNFNNRARPESIAMMDYIRAGEVGRINSAQAVWTRRAGIPGMGGWFTNKAVAGGGPVIDLLHMLDLALYFMGYPEPEWVLAQTFDDFIGNKSFIGQWGNPAAAGGTFDVETACSAFIRFKTGQVLSLRTSWAEMIEREVVSVTFQGAKAGGCMERLFLRDGREGSSVDRCELYTLEHGRHVNRSLVVDRDESMGRNRSVANFVRAVEGTEQPFNTPAEALVLMRVIDAIYASAARGEPIRVAAGC
jgi:predicted dehydrogenase